MDQVFGWTATVLLALCAIPQFIKICYAGRVESISSWTWWMFLVGHLFAIAYAALIWQVPLIVKYAVNIVISSGILIAYYRYYDE